MREVTRASKVSEVVLGQMVERGGGVPIFLEELGRMAESGGVGPEGRDSVQRAIPMTLRDSLMARLDTLGEAKEVAQLGATLGREFSFELLTALSGDPGDVLRERLDVLVDAEFLFRRRDAGDVEYVFKHALVRDMAYQSLLHSNRQRHHASIARVLEERFPEITEARPELVGYHYREAGPDHRANAAAWLRRAGERSLAQSAPTEASVHLARRSRSCRSFRVGPSAIAKSSVCNSLSAPPT